MNGAAFPKGRPKEKRHAPEAQPRNLDSKPPVTVERSEHAGSPALGRGPGGGGTL